MPRRLPVHTPRTFFIFIDKYFFYTFLLLLYFYLLANNSKWLTQWKQPYKSEWVRWWYDDERGSVRKSLVHVWNHTESSNRQVSGKKDTRRLELSVAYQSVLHIPPKIFSGLRHRFSRNHKNLQHGHKILTLRIIQSGGFPQTISHTTKQSNCYCHHGLHLTKCNRGYEPHVQQQLEGRRKYCLPVGH